jgi:hypothetical protein
VRHQIAQATALRDEDATAERRETVVRPALRDGVLRAGRFLHQAVIQQTLHRVPHYTALLLLVLLGGALLTGLILRQPRSFCQGFCPAAALLSVYGRYTPLQLDARDPDICATCRTRDCVRGANRYRFDNRSCPSLLRPFHREPSDGCVLCLQFVKVCPHDNIGVGIVAAEAPARRKSMLRPFEAAFVMLALGFVAHEVIGEVRWLDSLFHIVPTWLATSIPAVPFRWLEALWFLLVFPFAVWAAIAGVGYLAGHRTGLRSLLLAAATGAAPVVAVAHLAKAMAKVASWGAFLPLSLRDPRGVESFGRIADDALVSPARLLDLSIVGWVMLALILLVAWRAMRWASQMPAESAVAAKVGLAGAAALFSGVLTVWALPFP